MELIHFVHAVGATRGHGTAQQPGRQSVSVWDARASTQRQLDEQIPRLLREIELGETSHFDSMPWLRAILLVSPQPSDTLGLSVMDRGVVVLEAARENPAVQVIDQFLDQAERFQAGATQGARTTPPNPGPANSQSEFSEKPTYFEPALYTEWLGKLSQPWHTKDAFDSET